VINADEMYDILRNLAVQWILIRRCLTMLRHTNDRRLGLKPLLCHRDVGWARRTGMKLSTVSVYHSLIRRS